MPRRPCTFKQQDVTRALKATVAAGISVQRVEIEASGKIVLVTGAPLGDAVSGPTRGGEAGGNDWEDAR